MRRLVTVLTGLCLLIVFAVEPVPAQEAGSSESVPELNERVKTHFAAGELERALTVADTAIETAIARFGETHHLVAVSLNSKATVLHATGAKSKAGPLFERAIRIWAANPPSDSLVYGAALYNLAVIYKEQNRLPDADQYYRQALDILEPRLGKNDLNLANLLFDMGDVFRETGACDSAEIYYRDALARQQASLPKYDLRLARTWNNLGICLAEQGDLEQAEEAYTTALNSLERVLGPNDLEVGYCIQNLATLKSRQHDLKTSERLAHLALGIFEDKLGPATLEVAEMRYILGTVQQRQKKYAAAEKEYLRAREILAELKSNKATSARRAVLTSLREVYETTGDLEKAEAIAGQLTKPEK